MSIETAKKIRDLLSEANKKQKDLIEAIGEGQSTVAKWLSLNQETNRDMPYKVLTKTAKFLNTTVDSLINSADTKPVKKVPIVATASCGGAEINFLQEEDKEANYNGEYWHKDLYCVIANGDSMAPEIEDGDEVICDPTVKAQHGDMVHYTIDDESAIKVLVIDEEAYIMQFIPYNQSENFKVKTVRLDDDETLQRLKYHKVVSVNKLKYNNKQARLKLVGRG